MGLTASHKSTSVSTPAPAGNHVARCVRVIDLGMQKDDGQFGLKIQHKLMLTWELPDEKHTFKEENGPEPFQVSKEYTVSLHEKAGLRKELESWRGRAFTAEELDAFNVGKLLGAPCLLNVIHSPRKDGGGMRAKVGGISPLPKGFKCPDAISPQIKYEVEQMRDETFKSLPEWIQNRIASCEDWKAKPSANEHVAADEYADANTEPDQPF